MTSPKPIRGVYWAVLCVVLVASACSTTSPKADKDPAESTSKSPAKDQSGTAAGADKQRTSSNEQASDQPDASDDDVVADQRQADDSVPAPDDVAPDQVETPGEESAGGAAQISPQFKADLSDALAAAGEGERQQAVGELQELADDSGGGFLAAFNLGVLYENEGNYEKAARRYSQALGKDPGFSPALRNLVRLYVRLGQVRDAQTLARKYANARPENMTHRAIGLELDLHQGKYEEAIRAAKHILRRDETNVGAMVVMAEANIELGRAELAEAILDRARELRPKRAEIYFKYARIRTAEDKVSDAISLLRRAIELRPSYPEAHNNLGLLYHEAGDDDSAVAEFRSAIGDYPDYRQAYLNLGNALKGLGKFSKAKQGFKKALSIDPNYADALFNLGVLYLDSDVGDMDKVGQLNTAIDYFTKYKRANGGRIDKDDPATNYIQEARQSIEVEKQRQEMMRQAQMGADDSGSDNAESNAAQNGGDN